MNDIFDHLKELTKLDVEFSNENTHYSFLKSYIKCVEQERILIDPPSFKGTVYPMHDGQLITITISTNRGAYSGECKIIERDLSTISGLWITFPLSSRQVQRREFLRVPLKKKVEITLFKTAKKIDNLKLKVETIDISGKGISFFTDSPLGNYYEIECTFSIDDSSNQIWSRCEHVYSKETILKGKIKYLHALAFIELTNKNVELIVRECFKYQLEMRKRSLT